MEKKDIILAVVLIAALGFSIYRRIMKKNQGKGNAGTYEGRGGSFTSSSKDDDYEPYSGSRK